MRRFKVVAFVGYLHTLPTLRVSGLKWKVLDSTDDIEAAARQLADGRRNGLISGVLEMTAAGPHVIVDGVPPSQVGNEGRILELLLKLLEKAISELIKSIADEFGDGSPDTPERRAAWEDDEEFARVKREVEAEAVRHLPVELWPSDATPVSTPEPVAYTCEMVRRPYDPEKDATPMLADSLSIMGFRTARGIHRGKGVRVAVLDTGCRRSHPAIPATVRPVIDCTGRGGGESDPNGHGTFVCSQIVGVGPASDPVGTATEIELIPIQVMDASQGWGLDSWIARGIDTAVRLGCKVISMSLGGNAPMPLAERSIKQAYDSGVIIVAAAGNGGHQMAEVAYPARYTECIQVGACDDSKRAAPFSQGQRRCDIYACGVAQIGATGANTYGKWDGTSMATPHIAAACAMYSGFYSDVHGDAPGIGSVAEDMAASDENATATDGGALTNAGFIQVDGMLTAIKVPSPVDPTPPSGVTVDLYDNPASEVIVIQAFTEWLFSDTRHGSFTVRATGKTSPGRTNPSLN